MLTENYSLSQFDFTVVTCYTPAFDVFRAGLTADCSRLKYTLHAERLDSEFETLIHAFDYKISFIRRMVERFGVVLWLDTECRIVSPIPEAWRPPLITTYQLDGRTGYSSGVLMMGPEDLEFLSLWEKYARKYPRYPDDFVFEFLHTLVDLSLMEVPFEFYERTTSSPVVRGMWENDHTIVQHPTVNRWPDPLKYRVAFNGNSGRHQDPAEAVSRQRKGIYYRNFGGDFRAIVERMCAAGADEFADSGWVFDPDSLTYAPEFYWPELADSFASRPRSFDQSQTYFQERPARQTWREQALSRMKLDRTDRRTYLGHDSFGPMQWLRSIITRRQKS